MIYIQNNSEWSDPKDNQIKNKHPNQLADKLILLVHDYNLGHK